MTLKEGETVNIDGVEFEVQTLFLDGYWFAQANTGNSYINMMYRSKTEVEELAKSGRLTTGKIESITPGYGACTYHGWQKYVGAREIYDFCQRCGAKRKRDWRTIKDEREY